MCQKSVPLGFAGLVLLLLCAEVASAQPPAPRWSRYNEFAAVGDAKSFQAIATSDSNLAFRFDWGDATSTRDPVSGFYAPQPNPNVLEVLSAEVFHAWSAPGTYTVRVFSIDTAGRETVSEPVTMTVSVSPDETHTDCGQAGDAGDSVETARPITLPVTCAGRLEGQNAIDAFDYYRFEVTEPFRLLTVFTSGTVVPGGVFLYDPTGARDAFGNLIAEPIPFHYRSSDVGGFAWTLLEAGTWTLRVGSSLDGNYTLTLGLGGGGNDCVAGRVPSSIPEPIDAMNNTVSMTVGAFGAFECDGTLVSAAEDYYDSYVFDTAPGGELVALSFLTPDQASSARLQVNLNPPEFFPPTIVGHHNVFDLEGNLSVFFSLQANAFPDDPDVSYRMRFQSTTRRTGDCYAVGDAGNTFAAATPLWPACIAELTAADTEDWYKVPASAGDEIHVSKVRPVPAEIYDPDGIKRADSVGSVMIDKTGDWRVRTVTDKPGFAHFEGMYALKYFFRKGWPDRDCGTGLDTGLTGLTVALPVTCNGDFLPWSFSTTSGEISDRYNFHLSTGDTVTVTLSIFSAIADYWVHLDSPAPATVFTTHGSRLVTFSYTANQTGQWSVLIERAPLGDPADTRYTIAISSQPGPPAAPTLLSPANDTKPAQPVTFDWTDVSGATSYRIQIDDSNTFSSPLVVDQTVSASQFTAGPLASNTPHWWRVQGINSQGTAGAWSTVWNFRPGSAPSTPTLSAISLGSTMVVGGNTSPGTATLTSAAPSGGALVALASSNTGAATVPSSVTVAAGATSATFTVSTVAVTASTSATISGTYAGTTRSAVLTVEPAPAPASLSAISVSPASVTGGNSSQGTVTLTAAAPAGGFMVALSSDNAAAAVPASVTVAQGDTSATFTITTSTVTASTTGTMTASAGGVTRTATLTVNPPPQTVTLTVTATGRSGERVLSNPVGINVAVGSTGSASFAAGTAVTLSVSNNRDAVWSGACSSGGSKTKSCTLTITANASVTANVQ